MNLSFSKPVENPTLVVASYGGGLQSTAMLLMAAHGEITPVPDFAIISDMQEAEGEETLDYVRWMSSGNVLPFPIHSVTGGDLLARTHRAARHEAHNAVPFYTTGRGRNPRGQLRRACTRDFKIRPGQAEIRRLLGLRKGQRVPAGTKVEHWIGFTVDEFIRATPSDVDWDIRRWPLIEKEFKRHHCEDWLVRNGYPVPPKSRCKFCPFTSDERWAALKAADSEDWREAVRVDRAIRSGFKGSDGHQAFVHDSLRPLEEVEFQPGRQDLFQHVCGAQCGT